MTVHERFAAAVVPEPPLGLQVLLADPPEFAGLETALRSIDATLAGATVELAAATPELVPGSGPPASLVGLVSWPGHVVKLIAFAAPMPYGPVETCVRPAALPPPLKVDADQHVAHVLLYHAGPETDPLERLVAVAAVAGAVSRFGGIVVLNEDARAAIPAFDLIPEHGEDLVGTLRGLPVPYLWGGFVALDVGETSPQWVRTFACHRLGLPNLAHRLNDPSEMPRLFRLFAGVLGYAKAMGETLAVGDLLDLGDGTKLRLRAPGESEWYLESEGTMLVIEPERL